MTRIPRPPPSYGKQTCVWPANKIGVIVFSTILGSVVVAAIATPIYKQHYYLINGKSIYTWFTLAEVILGLFFVLKFVIKVLADDFIFTQNTYLLNTWNHHTACGSKRLISLTVVVVKLVKGLKIKISRFQITHQKIHKRKIIQPLKIPQDPFS
ncbi:hypothetical protein PTTG_06646 [Puccinia triticina 1-1 BBBD Race 1]|uniref:Uncharacterized protein n=1 Tax=Puccinia triticina (isolate 1-1 / race 1 (BBBD)) TaxID=630390 RepID=A0A180H4Z0_PUCT1|nr:hypothetical protein PTTG_06646 [Puccinia triticina 1-1 BBBD Race 1]